jgi:hypothetical protein
MSYNEFDQAEEEALKVAKPLFGARLDRVVHATLFYLLRAGASWMIANGFYYFEIVRFSMGTVKYMDSPLIDTGRNFIFIGIFVILIITGSVDDGRK